VSRNPDNDQSLFARNTIETASAVSRNTARIDSFVLDLDSRVIDFLCDQTNCPSQSRKGIHIVTLGQCFKP
jgi:hypothetical protein